MSSVELKVILVHSLTATSTSREAFLSSRVMFKDENSTSPTTKPKLHTLATLPVEDENSTSPITKPKLHTLATLPVEIVSIILGYLPAAKDLDAVAATNKSLLIDVIAEAKLRLKATVWGRFMLSRFGTNENLYELLHCYEAVGQWHENSENTWKHSPNDNMVCDKTGEHF